MLNVWFKALTEICFSVLYTVTTSEESLLFDDTINSSVPELACVAWLYVVVSPVTLGAIPLDIVPPVLVAVPFLEIVGGEVLAT